MWQNCFIIFALIQAASTLEIKNNACSNLRSYRVAAISPKCTYNPNVLSNLNSIVKRHGYSLSQHPVTTNDGYILNLFRISSPHVIPSKYPIFILHGIAINAESWVSTGNKSLAFNLVELSYDVWVGTVRGTVNANNHVNLTVNDAKYWQYNLDTIAREDVSTQLNFISGTTKQKVLIIGHSMGTTVSFMYTSAFPQANEIVRGVVALAPVAYLNGIGLIEMIRPWALLLIEILNALNIKGLFYHENFVHSVETMTCKIFPEVCYFFLTTLAGKSVQFPRENLLLFMSYWPSGISIFQLKHFLQITGSKRFQKFDYGRKNKRVYGTSIPPAYNLAAIQVPVSLFYGKNDLFYTKQNIERLFGEIGTGAKFETAVPVNQNPKFDFNHLDFLDSRYIEDYFYRDLFAKIQQQYG